MSRYFFQIANRTLVKRTRLLPLRPFQFRGVPQLSFETSNKTFLTNEFSQERMRKESTDFFNAGFTSKHYKPMPGEVVLFLNDHYQFPRKTDNKEEVRIRCPSCRPRKSTLYTAVMDTQKGSFHCDACMKKGNWGDYIKLVSKSDSYQVLSTLNMGTGDRNQFSMPLQDVMRFPEMLRGYPDIIDWCCKKKGLTKQILQQYMVGAAMYPNNNPGILPPRKGEPPELELCITFPRTAPVFTSPTTTNDPDIATVRIKACDVETGDLIAFDPPSFGTGLFGYHLVRSETDVIILTGNEFDAMAAYQETRIPATCLPNNSYQLPLEVLPLLERFVKIYIWLDDDVPGQDSAEKFARKLGIDRCAIVRTLGGELDGPRNAGDALAAGKDLNKILNNARPLDHDQIVGFDNLKEAVYREIVNPDQVRGVQSTDIPGLNQILKGHRPGELTIFTGPTGIGKTTILSQLSLDYCRSGVSTLWGSFEIPNVRLAKKMLQQFAGRELSPEEFFSATERFQQLPMYFLKFFGSTDLTTVVDAMDHAIYAFDVQHVIIDNLQFMSSEQGRFYDRWELQDRIVNTFRKFATERSVHITLVVHPKKDDREFLDLNSVFGSAKITQEADNVIIVQRLLTDDDELRYLDIKKNRFDGTLAAIPFEFDKESSKIRQLTRNEHDRRAKGNRQRYRHEDEKMKSNNSNVNAQYPTYGAQRDQELDKTPAVFSNSSSKVHQWNHSSRGSTMAEKDLELKRNEEITEDTIQIENNVESDDLSGNTSHELKGEIQGSPSNISLKLESDMSASSSSTSHHPEDYGKMDKNLIEGEEIPNHIKGSEVHEVEIRRNMLGGAINLNSEGKVNETLVSMPDEKLPTHIVMSGESAKIPQYQGTVN
ncbi:hypothetical protein G9A89_012845 [Geosiphon pyriformis]|nr:hypothetical protein G9A89_012845 [Geosiphon pyriformis]